jgi:hypothetical protein
MHASHLGHVDGSVVPGCNITVVLGCDVHGSLRACPQTPLAASRKLLDRHFGTGKLLVLWALLWGPHV